MLALVCSVMVEGMPYAAAFRDNDSFIGLGVYAVGTCVGSCSDRVWTCLRGYFNEIGEVNKGKCNGYD